MTFTDHDALAHLAEDDHARLDDAHAERLIDALDGAWSVDDAEPLPDAWAEEASRWSALDAELAQLDAEDGPANDDVELRSRRGLVIAAALAAVALLGLAWSLSSRDHPAEDPSVPVVQGAAALPTPPESTMETREPPPRPAPEAPAEVIAALASGVAHGGTARSTDRSAEPVKRVLSIPDRGPEPERAETKPAESEPASPPETTALTPATAEGTEPPAVEVNAQERYLQRASERCRERTGERASGRLVFDVHVDDAGRVTRLGHTTRDYGDGLARCLEQAFRAWTFEERGANFQVVFRFKARP